VTDERPVHDEATPEAASDAAASGRSVPESEPGNGAGPTTPVPGDPVTANADLGDLSVEQLISDLEAATRQRDEYLEHVRRVQADFENYRKRIMKQQADAVERAAQTLVEELLPVLDACDGAVRHGADEVEPIYASLLGTLEKQGLERIDPIGETFDPTRHEAVMHEPDDSGDTAAGEPVVVDVMRAGYAWKSRLVRPAMVKVRG
jgi:molecular chaperone GrpE